MSPTRYARPQYVTWLCVWILILSALGLALSVVVVAFNALHVQPEDEPGQQAKAFVLGVPFLTALCAIYMLRGANWARILFFVSCVPVVAALRIFIEMCVAYNEVAAVPAWIGCILCVLVYCIALSMEGANRYFTRRDTFFKAEKKSRKGGGRSEHAGRFDY